MPLPDAATDHYRRQQRLTAATLLAVRREWQRLGIGDFDAAWRTIGPRLLTLTIAAQRAAVRDSIAYVPTVLDELEIDAPPVADLNPAAFVGIASDGRPLNTLLYEPVIRTRATLAAGSTMTEATFSGGALLEKIVRTQLADTARAAVHVGMVARPAVTRYVRMLQGITCSRCAVLAGRVYRMEHAFLRHANCDCRHVPATESTASGMTTDPRQAIEAGQVTGLSKADTKAIVDDGADVSRVVNAKRGVNGATRARRAGRVRPDDIYRLAGSRDEAIRILRRHGYLT